MLVVFFLKKSRTAVQAEQDAAAPAPPRWSYAWCRGHIHVEIMCYLEDGTCATFHSPGLPDDREVIESYLEFISALTDVNIGIPQNYVPYKQFPLNMRLLEEPLELKE